MERVVIVTPSVYRTDNSATIFGMKARGASARGIAVIDDAIPQAEKRKATAERNAAKEKADSDVDIRYAAAAADVAKYEYLKNKEAYDTVKNAVPWVEVKRLELAWQRALLQIEQSNVERRINKLTVETKAAEMDAAEEGIRHRQIKSPLDGVVVQVTQHEGEWVKPGDMIMHIVRMDRLRVEGYLKSSDFAPQDVRDRKVIVTVKLAHRPAPVQFSGHVVFVSPIVEQAGDYKVWAEVDNRLVTGRNDDWELRPGETVSMSIDTKETLAASGERGKVGASSTIAREGQGCLSASRTSCSVTRRRWAGRKPTSLASASI